MAHIPSQFCPQRKSAVSQRYWQSTRSFTPSPLAVMETTRVRPFRPLVEQNGAFGFDKILMAGNVWKRNRRTNIWKPMRLVLRPHILSIYSDQDETQLRHQINVSEITAVASRRSQSGRQQYFGLFAVFMLSRTFYLEADSNEIAMAWIQAIGNEAHLNEDLMPKPSTHVDLTRPEHDHSGRVVASFETVQQSSPLNGLLNANLSETDGNIYNPPHDSGSSTLVHSVTAAAVVQVADGQESLSTELEPLSSTSNERVGAWEICNGQRQGAPSTLLSVGSSPLAVQGLVPPSTGRDTSYQLGLLGDTKEMVIWHGHLYCRLSHRAIRSWKNYWVVLRHKNIAVYRDEEEYAALLIVPLSSIVDVVEMESKDARTLFRFQIITDDRVYRLRASDEADLSNWIGRIKSALARRKARL